MSQKFSSGLLFVTVSTALTACVTINGVDVGGINAKANVNANANTAVKVSGRDIPNSPEPAPSEGASPEPTNIGNQATSPKPTSEPSSKMTSAVLMASITVIELMRGLAVNAGNIGGGNIIAAGGGNYLVLASDSLTTTSTLDRDSSTGTLKSIKPDGTILIDATYKFNKKNEGGKLVYGINDFKGRVGTFSINIGGAVHFDSSRMSALFKGTLSNDVPGHTFTLNSLAFDTPVLLRGTIDQLGMVKIRGDKSMLDAKVELDNDDVKLVILSHEP